MLAREKERDMGRRRYKSEQIIGKLHVIEMIVF